ncbi:hypothetical protein HNQ56_004276 [Anaerotaenia torta]|uniref:hypothetical protein n=1 Tax=Anaerotaenia torta TaxID=433293 RepID=UPI003D25F24A
MNQKPIGLLPDSRGIKLDIYANDKAGSVSNCERQQKRGRIFPSAAGIIKGTLIWTRYIQRKTI